MAVFGSLHQYYVGQCPVFSGTVIRILFWY